MDPSYHAAHYGSITIISISGIHAAGSPWIGKSKALVLSCAPPLSTYIESILLERRLLAFVLLLYHFHLFLPCPLLFINHSCEVFVWRDATRAEGRLMACRQIQLLL
jgi:hypothetical protein